MLTIDINDFSDDIRETVAEMLSYDIQHRVKPYDGDDLVEMIVESIRGQIEDEVNEALNDASYDLYFEVTNHFDKRFDLFQVLEAYRDNPNSITPWVESLKDVEGEYAGVKYDGDDLLNYFTEEVLRASEREHFRNNFARLIRD